MFNQHIKIKIRNKKIYCWRLELSCNSFDIVYGKGLENMASDTYSQTYCASLNSKSFA